MEREKRILTGKSRKLTYDDYKKAYYDRKFYESNNLGNFEKIYPIDGIVRY